jgi:Flp pilus assembly protein TadD
MRTIIRSLLLLIIAAGTAASCDTGDDVDPAYEPPEAAAENTGEYDTPAAALRAADALRASGANAAAMAVAAGAYRRFPYNPAVTSAYGRLALINGNHALAARLLRDATAALPEDWRALSALGVLDSRSGRPEEAREALIRARAASGGNAVALNNLAVSCLLDGQPGEAAALLHHALASPLIKPDHRRRMTRNLALALAVDGQFDEADAIAGEPMPRELDHASPAAVRRFMGLNGPAFLASPGPPAHVAKSWRPAEVPTAE